MITRTDRHAISSDLISVNFASSITKHTIYLTSNGYSRNTICIDPTRIHEFLDVVKAAAETYNDLFNKPPAAPASSD